MINSENLERILEQELLRKEMEEQEMYCMERFIPDTDPPQAPRNAIGYEEELLFEPCSRCDGHPACEDCGCAVTLGLEDQLDPAGQIDQGNFNNW